MKKFLQIGVLLSAGVVLTACQGTDMECAAMGAGAGYLAADVLGTNRAGGALIGGAIGATGNQTGVCVDP